MRRQQSMDYTGDSERELSSPESLALLAKGKLRSPTEHIKNDAFSVKDMYKKELQSRKKQHQQSIHDAEERAGTWDLRVP